jgi:hypothetical protein
LISRGTVIVILVALTLGPPGSALAADAPHHPVNLSFLYPISTNKNPDISTTVQLAILEGRIGSIRGLALNGGVSLLSQDMHGIQLTGIYSQIGGATHGLLLTGGINYNLGEMHGIEIGGLANLVRGHMDGLQIGGFFNAAGEKLNGIQIASAFNFVQSDGGKLQIAGVANTVGGNFKGAQLAFGYNIAAEDMQGLQISGVNMALDMHGAQIGLMNIARDAKGLQIGVLNRVREQNGFPLGMVNIEQNGAVEGIVYYSNLSGANAGVRTTVKRFYSMLTAGAPDGFDGDSPQTVVLTWNYGYEVISAKKAHVGLDLGWAHYIPWDTDVAGENRDLHFAFQARGVLDLKLNSHVSAFGGGGMAWIYPDYSLASTPESEGLYFAGLALR